MNKLSLSLLLASAIISSDISADKIDVTGLRYSGPFPINSPIMTDSIDAGSKKFNVSSILDLPVALPKTGQGRLLESPEIPASEGNAIHFLNFRIDNNRYFEGSIKIDSLKNYAVYVDGNKLQGNKLVLTPASHDVIVKCLTFGNDKVQPVKIEIEGANTGNLKTDITDGRLYTLRDVMSGRRVGAVIPSPSGKYLITSYTDTHEGGSQTYMSKVSELATGRQIATYPGYISWMPKSDLLFKTEQSGRNIRLLTVNPADGTEKVVAENLPSASFILSPNSDYILYTQQQEVPFEKSRDLYEILHPEDRQPGWRQRGKIMKHDLATGITSPVTFGNRRSYVQDISGDGSKILLSVHENHVDQRPAELVSLYVVDVATNKADTIFENEGFTGGIRFSPDGTQIAITGSPEAFKGVGKNLPEGRTPSMYDHQLYVMDLASRKVTPLTRDFNPSVESILWNPADNMIYFQASNGDRSDLYRVNPSTGKIENLNSREENVMYFALSRNAPVGVYFGQGASNSDRIYSFDTRKTNRHNLVEDLSAKRLDGIKLGEVNGWKFQNSRGDSISCYYVLPPDFEASKSYPMIVNYYGGCTPTTRTLESRYPHQVYAANGYVVLVINPSGAAGFGQEFASRHVNTAGEGVADDIIEAVKGFSAEHPWVNSKKIGCIGASYGGFMTQYLQTKTDIFAAAVSHAGISDHSSYWGNGYWGYSYSEVSMANSYPWSQQDLYVKRSPFYNADKIHTPLLFLHGDADTNVPFSESVQMFTALKRLNRPTAFVAVKDANHQVFDYNKRMQWQETIFAWFAKYLQDDPSWWERLYPSKPLN